MIAAIGQLPIGEPRSPSCSVCGDAIPAGVIANAIASGVVASKCGPRCVRRSKNKRYRRNVARRQTL